MFAPKSFPPVFSVLAAALITLCSGGLSPTFAQNAAGYQWDSVRIGGGGFVSAIVTSKSEPDLVYARTDVGGAYRWDAGSGVWIALNDWTSRTDIGYLGVESLAIDEANPNRVYMLVGTSYFSGGRTAILRSEDYGATFETIEVSDQFRAHGNGMGRQNGEKLVVDPNDPEILYCGTRSHGLFKSVDRGSTWTRLVALDVTSTPTGAGISFVTVDPSSGGDGASQTLYVGVSRAAKNLYRSTDGGQSFALIGGAPANLMPQRGVLAPNGALYLTYGNGAGPHGTDDFPFDQGGVWKCDTANGDVWTDITPAGYANAFGGISLDPTNPDRLIASSINVWLLQDNAHGDRFFLSDDGGSTWTDIVARGFDLDPNGVTWIDGQSIHWAGSIEFDPFDANRAWVTSGNGVYRCDDLSATESVWKFSVLGLEETVPLDLVSIPDGPTVSVIGDYDGFLHTDPSAFARAHRPGIGTTTGVTFAIQEPAKLFRVGDKLQRSSDMGKTWTEIAGIKGVKGSLALSADGATLLHTPENSSVTYRSTDDGASWVAVTGLSIRNARPVADPVNASKFYVYGGSALYVSVDGGASFVAAATLPSGGSGRIATVLGREGHLWFAHESQGLYRSTDSGASFSKTTGVAAARAVGTGMAAPDRSYPTLFIWGSIDGVEGVFRSIDEGDTWLRVNDDAHQFGGPGNAHVVIGDQNVFGRVYMSTAGRGIAYGEPLEGESIPLAEWQETFFTPAELADTEISGMERDPDGDGLTNLLEWLLGADPMQADFGELARIYEVSSGWEFQLLRQKVIQSQSLEVHVSEDLVNWEPLGEGFVLVETLDIDEGKRARLRYQAKEGLDEPSPLFIRLSVNPETLSQNDFDLLLPEVVD